MSESDPHGTRVEPPEDAVSATRRLESLIRASIRVLGDPASPPEHLEYAQNHLPYFVIRLYQIEPSLVRALLEEIDRADPHSGSFIRQKIEDAEHTRRMVARSHRQPHFIPGTEHEDPLLAKALACQRENLEAEKRRDPGSFEGLDVEDLALCQHYETAALAAMAPLTRTRWERECAHLPRIARDALGELPYLSAATPLLRQILARVVTSVLAPILHLLGGALPSVHRDLGPKRPAYSEQAEDRGPPDVLDYVQTAFRRGPPPSHVALSCSTRNNPSVHETESYVT